MCSLLVDDTSLNFAMVYRVVASLPSLKFVHFFFKLEELSLKAVDLLMTLADTGFHTLRFHRHLLDASFIVNLTSLLTVLHSHNLAFVVMHFFD